MNNYTFIVNYDEATYVSQVNSHTLEDAFVQWFELFIVENLASFSEYVFQEIKNRINSENEKPILLNGLKNVWCSDFPDINGLYFSLNIVKS